MQMRMIDTRTVLPSLFLAPLPVVQARGKLHPICAFEQSQYSWAQKIWVQILRALPACEPQPYCL